MDFSQTKKWTIPVNGVQKEVKSVTVDGNTIWKGTWLYTIKLGNYVSSVKYKTSAESSWTTITSNTTVEVDSGLTLSIQAQDYSSEPTTNQYHYQMTNYNFNINRTEDNDGGEVTVYRTATAVINNYTLSGYCTNGTVTFYSSNSYNTQITTANYGTVVYYRCVGNEGYGDITGSLTVNENDFSLNTSSYVASVNIDAMIRLSYVMTFAKAGSNYGSWQNSSLTMYYGDKLSRSNNTVTCRAWNDNTVRWTNTFTNDSAPEWNYSVEYNNITSPVSSAQTITATTSRSRKVYTITFNGDGYCSWSSSTLTGYYGDIISRNGKTISIYKWDATSTLRSSTTLTVESETEYNYSTTYSTITSPITSNQTINASTTKGRKTFTVTLQNGSYGSWSSNSITAYYNDEIILSGNTVTVYKWDATSTARASSTYTLSGDTSQYDYSNSYSTSTTITTRKKITENIQVSSVDTRATKTYTITLSSTYGYWTNSSGSTITSIPNIYYGTACSVSSNKLTVGQSVYTFNANATTAQYSYSFSSITGTPTSITGNVTITGTATRALRYYTVSFACTEGSWSKASIASVPYGTTWSTSGTTVTLSNSYGSSIYTAGSSTGYSALASINPGSGTVTGNTTINGLTSYSRITWSMAVTMSNYVTSWRYKIDNGSWVSKTSSFTITGIDYGSSITIEGIGKESAAGYSYGGYVGTGTFSYGSAHSTILSCTRTRLTWSLSITKGSNMATVTYKKNSESAVTVTGTTSLTLDYSDTVVVAGTAQSEAPYNYGSVSGTGTFTYSSSAQSTTVSCSKWVKSYTLTPSVSGGSYGNWTITRTPNSSYGAPAAETWANPTTAKTIYYGDTITASSSAAGTRYGAYNYADSDFTVATGAWNSGDAITASITLTAKNSAPAYLYRWDGSDWIQLQSNWSNQSGYNNSYTDNGLNFNTTYTYHVAGYKSRSYWTRSASSSNYTGTSSVTGNVTASFTFTENSAQTESTWTAASPSTVDIATGSRNKYTITWKYLSAYPDTYTTTTESYYWGEAPSRTSPSTVTSGSYRKVFDKWNNLSTVTADRTIQAMYYTQFYITVDTRTGCSVTSNGSGWYSGGTINITTWGISDSRYYTFNSNQTTYTSTSSTQWTADQPKTISAPSVYTRLYRVIFNAIYNGSTFETKYGYYEYGEQVNGWEVYEDPYDYNAQYGYELGNTWPITVTANDQECNVEYDERYTRSYSVTVQAKYSGSVVASQTVTKSYGDVINSSSYYGSTYDPGYGATYTYSGPSYQNSVTVQGATTIATTYSTRLTAYCTYYLGGFGSSGTVTRGGSGSITMGIGSKLWNSSNAYIWYLANSLTVSYSPGYTDTNHFDSKTVSTSPSIAFTKYDLPYISRSVSTSSGRMTFTIRHYSLPQGGSISKSVTYRAYCSKTYQSKTVTVGSGSSGSMYLSYMSGEQYDVEIQIYINSRYQKLYDSSQGYGKNTHYSGTF